MYILHWLHGLGIVALEVDTVTIVVLTTRQSEELLNIVAACQVRTLVVEVDEVWIPVGIGLLGEEGSV